MIKEIVKNIQDMSGTYTPYVIFSDWVKMCALAIQNGCQVIHDEVWRKRESQYVETMRKYNEKDQRTLCIMYGMLVELFESELKDYLGQIFMESGCGSKHTGQFFTPFHVSYLTAKVGMPDDISEDNKLYLNEPSCGGGGMIIATAKVLKERNIDYQKCMDVHANDLDWNGVYMTYVQLSILGIKATVTQGDSLQTRCDIDRSKVFYTPKKMGMII